jgi:hypothetical protein
LDRMGGMHARTQWRYETSRTVAMQVAMGAGMLKETTNCGL